MTLRVDFIEFENRSLDQQSCEPQNELLRQAVKGDAADETSQSNGILIVFLQL